MSKIKRISAILLAAFVLCLSACGEVENSETTLNPDGTEPTPSQIQETASVAVSEIGSQSAAEDSSAEPDLPDNDGEPIGSDSTAPAADADNTPGNGSGDPADAQENAPTEAPRVGQPQSTEPIVVSPTEPVAVSPTEPVSPPPTENDNAEVDINDL